ncbi:glycosyltransferase family 2 protein [Rathayibacter sp. CAU 1779]
MRVVAVVVAYNRRDLLLECVEALHAQSRPLDGVVVVDNASTDGSAEALEAAFPDVDVQRLPINTGGAGGFTVAIEHAISAHHADLIWVMDDDTIPTSTALESMLDARSAARETPAILASRVVWTDGLDHPMNTPRRKPLVSRQEQRDADAVESVPIRSASFVSMLVEAEAVRAAGLPVAEYFIWNDDFEFTSRVLRSRRGLFVPASVVLHKTKARADTDADPGERFYYEVRNKLWLFRRSPALAWFEYPLYVGATARRWLRTYRRSADRSTIARTFRAGWSDGIRRSPRRNSAFLETLGVDVSPIQEFEETAR